MSLFTDRLERFKHDPQGFVIASWWDRRYGRNIPIFQSEQELAMLRMQSRILCASNAYAAGLIEGLTSYVIGTGYTYRATAKDKPVQALTDAIQGIIDRFLECNEWYGGEQPGLEEELFWRSCEDGEFFLAHFCGEDGQTIVRTVEPEQVVQPPTADQKEWLFGIHTAEDDVQRVLGYWIFFGDNPAEGKEYGPKQITHFRRNVKRSIKRGCPDFTFDTRDALEIASKLRRNMGLGAAIQASYAGIRQHEGYTAAQVEDFHTSEADYERTNPLTGEQEQWKKYDPGMVDIPKGMNFVMPPSASNASAHVEILQACLRGAGVRWNAPEWLPSADASNNNYASSLTAESPFVRTVQRRQTGYKAAFLRSVWLAVENWVNYNRGLRVLERDGDGEVQSERFYTLDDIKRLVEIQVEAPDPTMRDRLQEANRNQIMRMNGVLSPQTWCQKEGLDYDQEQANLEEHNERTGDMGSLPLPLPVMQRGGGRGGAGGQQGGPDGQQQGQQQGPPPGVAGGWTEGGGLQESAELVESDEPDDGDQVTPETIAAVRSHLEAIYHEAGDEPPDLTDEEIADLIREHLADEADVQEADWDESKHDRDAGGKFSGTGGGGGAAPKQTGGKAHPARKLADRHKAALDKHAAKLTAAHSAHADAHARYQAARKAVAGTKGKDRAKATKEAERHKATRDRAAVKLAVAKAVHGEVKRLHRDADKAAAAAEKQAAKGPKAAPARKAEAVDGDKVRRHTDAVRSLGTKIGGMSYQEINVAVGKLTAGLTAAEAVHVAKEFTSGKAATKPQAIAALTKYVRELKRDIERDRAWTRESAEPPEPGPAETPLVEAADPKPSRVERVTKKIVRDGNENMTEVIETREVFGDDS